MRFTVLLLCLFSNILRAQKTDIRPLLRDAVNSYGIPAVAVAVFSSDTLFAIDAYGLRRKDNKKDSVTILDRYHLGSNTKAFTAYWAALLVERGLLNWDTPLLEFFPEWEPYIHKDFRKMTLTHFLTHRSGLKPYMKSEEFTGVPWMRDTFTSTDHRIVFSKWVMREKPMNVPSYKYEYSNANYVVVAACLEKASGMSWETAMQEEVAKRLGIRIELGWPYKLGNDEPLGHFNEKNMFMVHVPQLRYGLSDYLAPSSDINVSINDYKVFVQEHLKGLKGTDNEYLKKETYEYMMAGFPAYSIGWINNQYKNVSSHDGYAGSFYAHVAVFRDKDLAIVMLMNSGARKHINGMYDLRRKVLNLVEKDRANFGLIPRK